MSWVSFIDLTDRYLQSPLGGRLELASVIDREIATGDADEIEALVLTAREAQGDFPVLHLQLAGIVVAAQIDVSLDRRHFARRRCGQRAGLRPAFVPGCRVGP